MTLRAVIADDEKLARSTLRRLIEETPGMECIGEAGDGNEAIALIDRLEPDLAFLDVRMPGPSGIEVAETVGASVPVIFTTAHDDYALAAFELGAIDYLRKPFGAARFQVAVERARPRIEAALAKSVDDAPSLSERIAFARDVPSPLDRLFVRFGNAVTPVKTAAVSWLEADGDYVAIHTAGRRLLLYMKLGELARRLDPSRFVRVHRSHIVNLDYVASIHPLDGGRLEIRLADGNRIQASPSGARLLRSRYR